MVNASYIVVSIYVLIDLQSAILMDIPEAE